MLIAEDIGIIEGKNDVSTGGPRMGAVEHQPTMLLSAFGEFKGNEADSERDYSLSLPPLFARHPLQINVARDGKQNARSSTPATPALCFVSSPATNADNEEIVGETDLPRVGYRSALCLSSSRHERRLSLSRSESLSSELCAEDGDFRESHTSQPNGALNKCEARVKRLDRLNSILESFALESWSSSENRQILSQRLKKNKFHLALKARMLAVRTQWIQSHSQFLRKFEHATLDSGLFDRARSESADIAGEVTSLRMLERQTLQTVTAMLNKMSEDIPVSGEEVKAALSHTESVCRPAKEALIEAVQRAATDKDSHDQTPRRKKGHLGAEATCILEDWLVRHFDNPYPTEEEKAELVRMTRVSLRQINNWLSNARVRIWRPAVENLHR